MKTVSKRAGVALALAVLIGAAGQNSFARESAANIGEVSFAGAEARLQLEASQIHPRVTVDIGDDVIHQFIVDTGAGVNVIDSSIATSLGYEVVGETEIGAPGGPQIPAGIVKIPLLRVGDVVIKDAEFVTMDVIGFSGGSTHGVLGVGLFDDYLVSFDRAAGNIKLSRESLLATEPGTLPYDAADSQIDIEILVAGKSARAHIDTGSMGEFLLPAEMMRSLPLRQSQPAGKARLVGGERDIQFAELQGSIQFAGLQFENPNIAFMSPAPGSGNIGSAVLADYVVAIDQKNHLIAFRKAASSGVTAAGAKPRRLGIRFQGMPNGQTMTIAGVTPGSLGEQAGLQAGDVLHAINDKLTGEYDMASLGALFGGQQPLKLDIERSGERKTVEIP